MSEKVRLLVVDDEEGMRHMLSSMLGKEGYAVKVSSNGFDAIQCLDEDLYDMVLCDVKMPGMDGLDFFREIKKRGYDLPVIIMSAYGSIDTAVEAIKEGAYDFVTKPFRQDEILLTLRKAEEREKLSRENRRLREVVEKSFSFSNIIGKSPRIQEVFSAVRKVADVKSTVLLMGESGTGKELVARAIHYNSRRKGAPFVAVNCGAIPENLMESELFGHVKGAFTDAVKTRKGLFEEAEGGTLFLDEIGELPLGLQVKLLRVLQEGEITRIGSAAPIKVDVRIVAATTKDLAAEVKTGGFRDDLFYRLNVFSIILPPLRERVEDIPLLVDGFIGKFREKLGVDVSGAEREALDAILAYRWPGNVRELENAVERAMIMAEGNQIALRDLPVEVKLPGAGAGGYSQGEEGLSIKVNSRLMEERLIRRALEETGGNRTRAAKLLEISHRALIYKIKEYGLS